MVITGAIGAIVAAYAAGHLLEFKRLDEKITRFTHHYESVFPNKYPKNVNAVIDVTCESITLESCEYGLAEPMGLGEQLQQIRPMSETVEDILKEFNLLERYGVVIPRDLKIKKGAILHVKAALNAKLTQALQPES
jgi:hypothetical protein